MLALQKGQYKAAEEILSHISLYDSSPRIKLELARIQFLLGNYKDSQYLFEELLIAKQLPWPVQQNVNKYLNEIDLALGFYKFNLAWTSETNPRNFTSSKEVELVFGEVGVIEPSDNKTIYGIQYSLNTGKALTEIRRTVGFANFTYKDYPNKTFDRITSDLGIYHNMQSWQGVRIRTGLESAFISGQHLYRYPYISTVYYPNPNHQFNSNYELKLGYIDISESSYHDAYTVSLEANFSKKSGSNSIIESNVKLELNLAEEQPYSYSGTLFGLGYGHNFDLFQVKATTSVLHRRYKEDDPLFIGRREDNRYKAGITLVPNRFRLFDVTPVIGVIAEKNNSSLDFYSYDKVSFVFKLQN
ncbi:porin family protein [Amphritea balenae]|nr:tetratricopeptide repeat protein [Amphritea balenae]